MSVAHKYNRWIITILLRGELLPSKPSIMWSSVWIYIYIYRHDKNITLKN
jgi:hypothetical protein